MHACVDAQADKAKGIKDECEAELSVAMPILNDALAALDTIKEADIGYIRKLGNPPAAIKLVMEVGHALDRLAGAAQQWRPDLKGRSAATLQGCIAWAPWNGQSVSATCSHRCGGCVCGLLSSSK